MDRGCDDAVRSKPEEEVNATIKASTLLTLYNTPQYSYINFILYYKPQYSYINFTLYKPPQYSSINLNVQTTVQFYPPSTAQFITVQ